MIHRIHLRIIRTTRNVILTFLHKYPQELKGRIVELSVRLKMLSLPTFLHKYRQKLKGKSDQDLNSQRFDYTDLFHKPFCAHAMYSSKKQSS